MTECRVRPAGVVVAQERWQPGGALGAVLPGSAIDPFAQAGLDKSLGLAIGLRVVRLGETVLDAQGLAGLGEQTRAVGRAVVSEQTLNAHTQGRVVCDGSLQKVHRRALALIGMHLHEAHAAVVSSSGAVAVPEFADFAASQDHNGIDAESQTSQVSLVCVLGAIEVRAEVCSKWR